jgi:hypothetical protein
MRWTVNAHCALFPQVISEAKYRVIPSIATVLAEMFQSEIETIKVFLS